MDSALSEVIFKILINLHGTDQFIRDLRFLGSKHSPFTLWIVRRPGRFECRSKDLWGDEEGAFNVNPARGIWFSSLGVEPWEPQGFFCTLRREEVPPVSVGLSCDLASEAEAWMTWGPGSAPWAVCTAEALLDLQGSLDKSLFLSGLSLPICLMRALEM